MPRDMTARDAFLARLRSLRLEVSPDTVIARDNIYRVNDDVHLLVRTSRLHEGRSVYFFGLTTHIFDNFSQLPNAVIAFVLSDSGRVLLIPAHWLWEQRSRLSASAKQYKLEVDTAFSLRVKSGKPLDLSAFHEQFELLSAPALPSAKVDSKTAARHAALQGMLLTIGALRGYQTFCPNKSPRFGKTSLGELTTVSKFPSFPGLNTDIIRQIDVVWLDRSFPVHAFEVELTTGIWSGLVRLGELRRLQTVLHIVTDGDDRAFQRRISGDIFAEIIQRCHHANASDVQGLYEAQRMTSTLEQKLRL